MNVMTLGAFRATGRNVADLGEALRDCGLEGVSGRMYQGDSFIEGSDSAPDQWCLTLYNEGFIGTLADMEAILYIWCLCECGDDMGANEALSLAFSSLSDIVGMKELAAIIAEPREDGGSIAALDDVADVDDATSRAWMQYRPHNSDAIEDAIGDVYAIVSWNDFATDDSRSNGPRA